MKIYTLLRDNQAFGSFTYEELLNRKLKKMDLLWIEGESIVWKYPSELKEFKNRVQEAELTEGTLVNTRKEKQINYFRWKQTRALTPIEEIQMQEEVPDAFLSDVPEGYEFLLAMKEVSEITDGIIYESLSEKEPAVDYDYKVLGTSQVIDTREGIAGSTFFESTIDLPVSYKSKKVDNEETKKEETVPPVRKKSRQKKRGSIKLPALLMIIASAFMHLRV